jgi:hypothetical protein
MNKIHLLVIFFLALFISVGSAEDSSREEYIVEKGDTLWDISNEKLNDSFLWPNIWRVNSQLDNPDDIFPGDTIRIPSLEDLMRLAHGPAAAPPAVEPVYVEEPAVEAVIMAPVEKPVEFILNKNLFLASGWIAGEYPAIGEVYASPLKRSIFGFNDYVYLKSDRRIDVGDLFLSIKKIKKVYHPKTGNYMGLQIRVTGILDVIGMDGKNFDVPKALVIASFEDIDKGNGIVPYTAIDPPLISDSTRTPLMTGYVVETYRNAKMSSSGDIVYLDKGMNDGLQVGDTFSALFQTPVERSIGRIQVFNAQPSTSVALVLKSAEEITIGDIWGNR